MKQFYIAEIVTKDKLIHQGIFYKPTKLGKRAILWVHCLTDTFYGDVKTFEVFAENCEKLGWGFASFNNRGHDIITSISKIDPTSPKGKTHLIQGAACEKFTDCVYDIDAALLFLEKAGFSEVILVGISTGANKACYYVSTQKDSRVVGVVLASAISDVGFKKKELGEAYETTLKRVKKLIKEEKGESFVEGLDYMPFTPNRFLSAYEENGAEDVFPYYQKNPKFKTYSKINKPMMVIMGELDEYADMPVETITKIYSKYQKSSNYRSVIIPDAFHSFGGKEKEFVSAVVDWIKTF